MEGAPLFSLTQHTQFPMLERKHTFPRELKERQNGLMMKELLIKLVDIATGVHGDFQKNSCNYAEQTLFNTDHKSTHGF